AFRIPLTR
nr:Chain B, ALA-PHE-ARG-ILE-PRO-LEU-THR-ARG [Ixodes ricinus]